MAVASNSINPVSGKRTNSRAGPSGYLGYGPRFVEVFRQRARMVPKVLRGPTPADLPVEQPTTCELVINLKTAKAIRHEMSAGLVLRADKVIE
jgi:putative ABC transport system substrate-binding protein